MGAPVVHFEVITSGDGKQLQEFYGSAFDWKINADNPMKYGVVETGGGDRGINGGVGGSDQGQGFVTFYVEVPDINSALKKIEELGGKTVMERTEIPNMVTFAQFQDPSGNMVGLVEPTQQQ